MTAIPGVPGHAGPPLLRQRWSTINPAHAIQRVAAALTFPEELPSFVVNRTVDAVRPIARKLGLFVEVPVNTATVQIGPGGAQTSLPMTQEGVSFQRVDGEQILQTVSITKQALRFETTVYTRWVAFSDQLAAVLDVALPILSGATTVNSASLEYVDFFFATMEGSEDAGLIIDNQSQLMPKRAFRKREPFHAHSGWFDQLSGTGRHLINVDITVGDGIGPAGVRRTVTIRTFEAEQVIDQTSRRASDLVQTSPVINALDALHLSLKDRLGNILTREAKAMISLGS